MRGYFGIGIEAAKNSLNVGGLWRSAYNLGAAFIFTIGHRYKREPADVNKAWRHVPLWTFKNLADFKTHIPRECRIVTVENNGKTIPLPRFVHPERAVYLLGAEDYGLSDEARALCKTAVVIPSKYCLNVATTGSIIMYDRLVKGATSE
jgi:tRNA G18 (ribose-2'-O)-methylase SpoU